MVDIAPIRGYRYNLAQVGALADVTAPPYDVIDPALQNELYQLSPFNVVRLILNRAEPGDTTGEERYQRAADCWKHWKFDGILQREGEDVLYVYHQRFVVDGTRYTRRGVMARLRLEPLGEGHIFPHEATLAAPKADRMKLLKASQANFEPIFGLYAEPANDARGRTIQQELDDACLNITAAEMTDQQGVVHQMWVVKDPAVIASVRARLRGQSMFIADGHHRYTTSLSYQQELLAAGQLDALGGANYVLSQLVSLEDEGLIVQPTHRLQGTGPGRSGADVASLLGAAFEIEPVGTGVTGARDTWELIRDSRRETLLGLGVAADHSWHLVRVTDLSEMADRAPDRSSAWQQLGVSILQELVLSKLKSAGQDLTLSYVHDWALAEEAIAAKRCELAWLVPACSVDDVALIAGGGETMPPKSTYFYPKLQSGLVMVGVEG